MKPDWIQITAKGAISKANGSPATPDELKTIAQQMAADAVYGTFGEFPDYLQDKWETKPEDLVEVQVDRDREEDPTFYVKFGLNPTLYDITKGGLQHLFGVLAGDLFFLRIPDFSIRDFHVTDVQFPQSFLDGVGAEFRPNAHKVNTIRSDFKLHSSEPLLAFSFKPRVGLKRAAISQITLGVLEAGFNIVEFDTRYLDLSDTNIAFLLELSKTAATIGGKKRITRLSPNLSIAAPLAIELCARFIQTSDAPHVVKVDGGFDGISTVQAIRQSFRGEYSPIITCYPLLREQLRSKIPEDTFVQALAHSGVDIIYPGQSPSIGKGARELGTLDPKAVGVATERYWKFVRAGWPMVTLAGGVYAGQLHALFELVGPDVAYFLGGAVSLHHKGPIEGAKLCVKIFQEAAGLHDRNAHLVKDFPDGLITEIEKAYPRPAGTDQNAFPYVSPKDLMATVPSLTRWP
jgi:ribulose 1,5-bisphosphate carboxylase large subunit-like protein